MVSIPQVARDIKSRPDLVCAEEVVRGLLENLETSRERSSPLVQAVAGLH